jgi:hypothetical protein
MATEPCKSFFRKAVVDPQELLDKIPNMVFMNGQKSNMVYKQANWSPGSNVVDSDGNSLDGRKVREIFAAGNLLGLSPWGNNLIFLRKDKLPDGSESGVTAKTIGHEILHKFGKGYDDRALMLRLGIPLTESSSAISEMFWEKCLQ